MTVADHEDLPLAGRERRWDADAAEARVRRWADAESEPNERYRKAFLWYVAAKKDEFTASTGCPSPTSSAADCARCLAGSWPPPA